MGTTPSPWYTDPAGLAAKISAAVAGFIALAAIVVGLVKGGADLEYETISVAVTAVVTGAAAVASILKARTKAFAPETVAAEDDVTLKDDALAMR